MCFKTKDGARIINSRAYRLQSGHRFCVISPSKNDRVLLIDLVNNQGNIQFKLLNLKNNGEQLLDNPETGRYVLNIEKETKYKIVINSNRAYGSYRISIKNKE